MDLHQLEGDGPIATASESDVGRDFVDAEEFAKGLGKGDFAGTARIDQCAIDVKEYGRHRSFA